MAQKDPTTDVLAEDIVETPIENVLSFRHRPETGSYEIFYPNGGDVPQECKGVFLTKRDVDQAISRYESRKAAEVAKRDNRGKKLRENQKQRAEGGPSLFTKD